MSLADPVDVAVVVNDPDWDFWNEKMQLSDIAYDVVMATGVDVQGWPVRVSVWNDPKLHVNPSLIEMMRHDGKVLRPIR
jgi:uncharacterized protein